MFMVREVAIKIISTAISLHKVRIKNTGYIFDDLSIWV